MLTTAPPPPASKCGSAARTARTALKKFTSKARCHCASSMERKSTRGFVAPTLLTKTSILPCRSIAAWISASTPSAVARSCGDEGHVVPLAQCGQLGGLGTAAATTRPPSRRNASVMARPMPLPAPVTTATFPVSSRSIGRHSLCRELGTDFPRGSEMHGHCARRGPMHPRRHAVPSCRGAGPPAAAVGPQLVFRLRGSHRPRPAVCVRPPRPRPRRSPGNRAAEPRPDPLPCPWAALVAAQDLAEASRALMRSIRTRFTPGPRLRSSGDRARLS